MSSTFYKSGIRFDNHYNIYIIDLQFITPTMLDDIDFSKFNYNIPFRIQGPCNPDLDIDKLMEKLNNIKLMIINYSNYNLSIQNPPSMLEELIDYSMKTNINLANCTHLRNYKIHSDYHNVTIPSLPQGITDVWIKVRSVTKSILVLPSSITCLTIELEKLQCNLDMWPVMLENLYVSVMFTGEYSISILPPNITKLTYISDKILYCIDIPPLLKILHIVTTQEYPYSLEDLPDGIEYFETSYKTKPDIMHLPKNCKKFVYAKCKESHFRELCKKYKGKCKIANAN
jgi:hypothetical protein